jgi:myo-inositol-1(or 4)-monophosphatase
MQHHTSTETDAPNLDKYLQFAIDLATHSGAMLLKSFGNASLVKVTDADNKGLLTESDLLSDTYIKNRIQQTYPTHALLTEESGESGKSEFRWVVDGLDGTNNHRRGDPNFSISIALQQNQESIVGVVFAPAFDSLYYAANGQGAFVVEHGKTTPIHVSGIGSKDMFTMSFAVGIDFNNPALYDGVVAAIRGSGLFDNFRRRMLESTALELCYLARGRTDAHLNNFLKPWDYAAGDVIVREAGGNSEFVEGQVLLASNGVIHTELRKVLRKVLAPGTQ